MEAPSYDRWLGVWLLAPLFGAFAPAHARADEAPWRCGESARPWVELRFEGSDWDPKLQQSIRADMAAGLRLRGLLVCPVDQSGPEPPLASVQLTAASITHVAVEIEVHDALTNKLVIRELDMRNLPVDARGLTLATAAEELLRASWAELALEGAPEPVREPPPEVEAAIQTVRPPERRNHVIGLRLLGEYHGTGQMLFGPEAWMDLWLHERFAAELSIGYRRGVNEDSAHGTIESQAAVFGADVLMAISGRSAQLVLLTRVGVQLASVSFEGRPGDNGIGLGRSGFNVSARASLGLRVGLTSDAELRVEVGPGVNLRGLTALDGEEEVTGTRGVLGHAELGFGAVF